mmetsp:Transcript_55114/g.171044  ORF Transcript_55114/g.171044 Transcript_55114/m.171044 type:complete len:210 (+) Transcript_55114:116-745(+)
MQTTERSFSEASLSNAFARLQDRCMRSTYREHIGHHDQSAWPSPMALGAASSTRTLSKDDLRRREKEAQRQVFATTYARAFTDYGADAKPAVSRKRVQGPRKMLHAEEQLREERAAALRSTIQAAVAKEELIRSGHLLRHDLGVTLTAPLEPPKPSVHCNYVGGLPPINWKSEARANHTVEVHSKSTNTRFGQPMRVSMSSSHLMSSPC